MEQLIKRADQIKKSRPTYEPILDFYCRVFRAQEMSQQQLNLPLLIIEPDLLRLKQENGLPLIDPSQFLFDMTEAARLFEQICDLASEYAPKLSLTGQVLKKALEAETLDLEILFSALLNNEEKSLNDLAEALDMPVQELVFFGFGSIAPGIQVSAQKLSHYIDKDLDLKKGICPICGNLPDLAFLDQEGRRHLKCTFCSHTWRIKRMGCVFCENNDPAYQHYFFCEEEKEYRVLLCDRCHTYVKLVDLRQMDREFYPNLELVSTLHLDMKAQEKGYSNGHFSENRLSH